MEKRIYDKKTGIHYELQGDYYLPCLTLPEQPKVEIGIWGKRHLRYIKQHHKIRYTNLLTSCKLTAYLADIDQQAEDMFGRMLAIGVFGHVALQVILNLMVVTSLFPTTGVTLPFFSAGGTASVFLFVEFGIVLNVEKHARRKREAQIAQMQAREALE